MTNTPTDEVTANLQRDCLRHILSDEGVIDFIVVAQQSKNLWQQVGIGLLCVLAIGILFYYLFTLESSLIQQWIFQRPDWSDSLFFQIVAVTGTQPWIFAHQVIIGMGILYLISAIRDHVFLPKKLIAQWTACSLLPSDANQLLKLHAHPQLWRFWSWRKDLRYLQQQLVHHDLEKSLLLLSQKRQRFSIFMGMLFIAIGVLVACVDITLFKRITPEGLESNWMLGERLLGMDAEKKDWNQVTKVEISCLGINPRYRVFFGKSKFDIFDSIHTEKTIPNFLKVHAQLTDAGVPFEYQPFPYHCGDKNILHKGKQIPPEVNVILSGK